ncbi:phosphoglycerate mutase-like protein [Irpex rosettiformis]|uniref:Phosphoglycerate mutase-like protein n=1 Tax=Irpex rosettiformis TaxID=378272 RepID=A0ACB8U2E9_9APHY|nr:phosphoglycerate mutase-like protein [Irpex rosettiformis]
MSTDSKILGVVLIARHGDREGFYQDPTTYTPSATSITPLGEIQEFALGNLIRSLYLDPAGPKYIGATSPLFNQSQVAVRADAGGEGGVIFDSAIAVTQGLFPPNAANKIKLANGTTVTSPFDGYQYVPIESVEPNEDVSLEGFTSCPNFASKNAAFYQSPAFLQKANESAAFLNALPPFLDGRPVTLDNMWNIYDFMNVQSIHNKTFVDRLPPTFLAQARDLANYHEYGVFSDPSFTGIGNIASRTMLPSLFTAMQRIVNASDPLLFHYSAISYKPFLSLFNMTGIIETSQLPSALVDYASALVFELRQPSDNSEPVIRLQFKNGTNDNTFHALNISIPGHTSGGDLPLSQFISTFEPAAVNTTLQWCKVCGQNVDRGCAALLGAGGASTSSSGGWSSTGTSTSMGQHDRISPVGAGFLGAGLTAAVFLMVLGAALGLGFLTLGRKTRGKTSSQRGLHSEESSIRDEK